MVAIDASLPKDIRILQAAEEVFSQHGYEKATLDEIIALADVGKGTVYKYFAIRSTFSTSWLPIKMRPFWKSCTRLSIVQTALRTSSKSILR